MTESDSSKWPDIPGYELVGIAGYGGGGIVFEAIENDTGRTVAIKSMIATDQPHKLNRFRKEARILAKLEHPHILPVYDFGVLEDRPFLVTRFARGGSVADRIDEGPVPIEQAVSWAIDIANALDLAHNQGLLHRDVKPSNMLLDEADEIYLSDFGLAGTFADEELAQAGSALYLSPERGKGETRIDVTADVYALAVSLFEMITGRPPYIGETPLAIRVMHIEAPVPSARPHNDEVSLALDDLIRWCMAKDPAERPPSAATFVAAAQTALSEPDKKVRLPSYLSLDSTPLIPSVYDYPPTVRDTTSARRVGDVEEKRPSRIVMGWLVFVGILIAAAVGIGLFTIGPFAPVEEIPPTEAAQVLPTEIPLPSPTPLGRLLFDDFSDPATSNDAIDEARLVSGALQVEVVDPQFRIYWPTERVQADRVHIELDWLPSDRSDRYEFGILCRWQDVNRYEGLILIVTEEEVSGQVWSVVDGRVEILAAEPVDERLVTRDQLHQVGVDCLQDQYRLSIDGQTVLTHQAASGQTEMGDVAILSRPLFPEEHLIRLDNLLVEDPS